MASILNLEVRPCAVARRFHDRSRQNVTGFKDVTRQDRVILQLARNHVGNARLVRIAHHPGNPRHLGQLGRRPLGITTSHQNTGVGILAMRPANRRTGILIRLSCYRTGVQDHHIGGISRRRSGKALRPQLRFERRTISLGGTASEILNKEAHRE